MRRASQALVWHGVPKTQIPSSGSSLRLFHLHPRVRVPRFGPNSRLFSSENDDAADEKKPPRPTKAERSAAAKLKLNDLLKSIVSEAGEKGSSPTQSPVKQIELKLAVPAKEKKHKKNKDPSSELQGPASEQSEPKLSKEMMTAVQSVAKSIGGDPNVIETELVQKLRTQSADKINLSELFLGMKIDRTKPTGEMAKEDVESGSRALRVRRILDDQQQSQRRDGRFDNRRERSISDSFIQRDRHRPSASRGPVNYVPIDLFGSKRLGIFNKQPKAPPPVTPVLSVWDSIHAKELKLSVTHPPANGFEEMIQWTNQGKLWHFPINNEQGLENETEVPFHEHVFLEPKISSWCPKQGPVRQFMELVCVALSKNPYLTVPEKEEYLEWYHTYFKGKSAILKEVGAGEVH